ncbi:MAG TPA: sialidase family protein [Casimicrobiaceae bacterium]|nr:sialidase family protein [Casimicrobiaceae bacterium]
MQLHLLRSLPAITAAVFLSITPNASRAFDLNHHGLTGSWFKPSTNGQGVELEVYQDLIGPGTGFLQGSWFTYDYKAPDGASGQRWYTFSGNVPTGQATASLTLYQNTGGNFDAPPITSAVQVGSVQLTAVDCAHLTLVYTFTDGSARSGTIDLVRLTPNVTCSNIGPDTTEADFGYSGNWFDRMTSGQGIVLELNRIAPVVFIAWYTYAPNGQLLGEMGQRWYTGQASYAPGARSLPMTLYETTGGLFDQSPPTTTTVPVGTATATLTSCTALQLTYNFTGGSSAGSSRTIEMSRVGPTPADCGADSQVRVSGLSPFAAGCDGVPAVGTLYVNTEVEPMIAANPRNTNNVIAVWQQDRWSNGGARGLLSAVSQDGGLTWTTRMAAFSRCTGGTAANGGDYPRASDPWVSFGPDGTAYQSSLSFAGDTLAAGSSSAILVSRSTDGGLTWSNPATVIQDGSDFFNDKDSITADPTDARFVYAVWDRLAASGGGPSYLGRSTDSGATWEPAKPIYDPGPTSQTINNQIVVLPNGTIIDFFTQLDTPPHAPASAELSIIRSTDKGTSWSAPIVISPVFSVGTFDPETHAPIRDGSGLGSIAVGRGGELVAVWQDARFSGGLRDGIAFSRSLDGGLTWSAPSRINHDASASAFVPAVTVRSDGTYGVTYYDFRNNTSDPATLPTDNWLTRSTDGVTWLESHVAGPFDLAIAPNAEGLFLGDYQGLSSAGAVFLPVYAQTNNGRLDNRTDVFVTLATSAAAATQAAQATTMQMSAPASEPLAMTPELQLKLNDSVVRTMQRRVPGWSPPGVGHAPPSAAH